MTFLSATAPFTVRASLAQRSDQGGARDLVSQAHPERLVACLQVSLGDDTLRRLQGSRRLQSRLEGLLAQSLGAADAPGIGPTEDHPVARALLAGPDLLEAARLAGAVWHARSLRLLVSGAAVGEIVGRIGRRAHGFGLRHTEHAVATSTLTAPAALAGAVERDGLLCLGAFFRAEAKGLRAHLLVRLPPGTPAESAVDDEAHLRHAPGILAKVAAELEESRHGS